MKKKIFVMGIILSVFGLTACGLFKNTNDKETNIVYDAEYPKDVKGDSYITIGGKMISAEDIKAPYINIESEDAKAANAEIKGLFDTFVDYYNESFEEKIAYNLMDYEYAIKDNVLSVVIIQESGGTDIPMMSHTAYNFDMETGARLSHDDMFALAGISSEAEEKYIREYVINFQYSVFAKGYMDYSSGYYPEDGVEKTMLSYKNAVEENLLPIFFDESGNLVVVFDIDAPATQWGYVQKVYAFGGSYAETAVKNAPEECVLAIIQNPDEDMVKELNAERITEEDKDSALTPFLIMPVSDDTDIFIEEIEYIFEGEGANAYFEVKNTLYEKKGMKKGEALFGYYIQPEGAPSVRIRASQDGGDYAEYPIAYDGYLAPDLIYVERDLKTGTYIVGDENDEALRVTLNKDSTFVLTNESNDAKNISGRFSILGRNVILSIEEDLKTEGNQIVFEISGYSLYPVYSDVNDTIMIMDKYFVLEEEAWD